MIATVLIIVLFIAAVVGWCGAIEAQQRADRAQARAGLALTAAHTARQERDEVVALSESQVSLIAAYRAANDRLYLCLRDRMDEEEYASLDAGLTVYDRLVTEAWDREWDQ